VRAGDTIVMRNLLPTSVLVTDRVRIFRINRTSYNAATNLLTVEPESPLPTLAALLARQQIRTK